MSSLTSLTSQLAAYSTFVLRNAELQGPHICKVLSDTKRGPPYQHLKDISLNVFIWSLLVKFLPQSSTAEKMGLLPSMGTSLKLLHLDSGLTSTYLRRMSKREFCRSRNLGTLTLKLWLCTHVSALITLGTTLHCVKSKSFRLDPGKLSSLIGLKLPPTLARLHSALIFQAIQENPGLLITTISIIKNPVKS